MTGMDWTMLALPIAAFLAVCLIARYQERKAERDWQRLEAEQTRRERLRREREIWEQQL